MRVDSATQLVASFSDRKSTQCIMREVEDGWAAGFAVSLLPEELLSPFLLLIPFGN